MFSSAQGDSIKSDSQSRSDGRGSSHQYRAVAAHSDSMTSYSDSKYRATAAHSDSDSNPLSSSHHHGAAAAHSDSMESSSNGKAYAAAANHDSHRKIVISSQDSHSSSNGYAAAAALRDSIPSESSNTLYGAATNHSDLMKSDSQSRSYGSATHHDSHSNSVSSSNDGPSSSYHYRTAAAQRLDSNSRDILSELDCGEVDVCQQYPENLSVKFSCRLHDDGSWTLEVSVIFPLSVCGIDHFVKFKSSFNFDFNQM